MLSRPAEMIMLGYAATTDVKDVSMMVVDHDQTAESRALIDAYGSTGYFVVTKRADRAEESSWRWRRVTCKWG